MNQHCQVKHPFWRHLEYPKYHPDSYWLSLIYSIIFVWKEKLGELSWYFFNFQRHMWAIFKNPSTISFDMKRDFVLFLPPLFCSGHQCFHSLAMVLISPKRELFVCPRQLIHITRHSHSFNSIFSSRYLCKQGDWCRKKPKHLLA